MEYILKLSEIPETDNEHFGGKALSLAKMSREKLPVPSGFAISSNAFVNGKISPKAAEELDLLVKKLPAKYRYAVRSSAVGEDGAENSFAGAYETLLDLPREKIREAVEKVAESGNTERVQAYSERKNVASGKLGVVIQRFVSPEFAGVMFTANAVTGSTSAINGNFVKGVGEALVSGENSGDSFTIDAVKYGYSGAEELRVYGKKFYKLAKKIVDIFGCPQDIEWAVRDGKIYILQARPITNLHKNDTERFLINDSLRGEFLFSKTNVGEIFLRPVSPATYSLVMDIFEMIGIPLIANVCGQLYCNLSAICSLIVAFGVPREKAFSAISSIAGGIPEGVSVPVYPCSLKSFRGKMKKIFKNRPKKNFAAGIAETVRGLTKEIHKIETAEELYRLWTEKCDEFVTKSITSILMTTSVMQLFIARRRLEKLCPAELADRLLSGCSEHGVTASLGVLLSVDDVISGKLSKEEYTAKYGHRHADEMELSAPYPYENPEFPDNVIADYQASGISAAEMKLRQDKRHQEAIDEFLQLNPNKSKYLHKILSKYEKGVYDREFVRSEALRVFCLVRELMLKAGELSGLGEDIFLLYIDEVKSLLREGVLPTNKLNERRENYRKQLSAPHFPNLIYGRFTEEEWLKSGGSMDYYRYGESRSDDAGDVLEGIAGSSGQAEGIARVISDISEADRLQKGEILVVQAANIGWVKIFPKAAAIVTEIGAPLSHAVIIARELGIPAAVSCHGTFDRISDGDRISVDGTLGKVVILERAGEADE